MNRRQPSRDEQAKTARLFAPPEATEPKPRPSLWQRMAHRQATCGGPATCPLCPPPAEPLFDAELATQAEDAIRRAAATQ